MNQGFGVFRVGFGEQLELLQRLVILVVGQQRLAQRVQRVGVARIHVGGPLVGGDGVLGTLQLVISRAQRHFHLRSAVVDRDSLNDFRGMGNVAAIRVETSQIEDHLFRIGLDGLGGLELVFRLLGLVFDGIELAQDHAVFHVFGLQRNNLFELGDGQVKRITGGRGRGDGVGSVAELAEVDAPQKLVSVHVIGRDFDQPAGGDLRLMDVASAEVKLGQAVIELG